MELTVQKMSRRDAENIALWVYEPPYDIYNMSGSQEIINELLDGSSISMLDGADALIGFFCFGTSARIPAGLQSGAYQRRDAMDVGLGLRPDLCSRGHGLSFLELGLRYAAEQFHTDIFRLTVASFNQRAIRVYEQAGFQVIHTFSRDAGGRETEFIVMLRGCMEYKPWRAKQMV